MLLWPHSPLSGVLQPVMTYAVPKSTCPSPEPRSAFPPISGTSLLQCWGISNLRHINPDCSCSPSSSSSPSQSYLTSSSSSQLLKLETWEVFWTLLAHPPVNAWSSDLVLSLISVPSSAFPAQAPDPQSPLPGLLGLLPYFLPPLSFLLSPFLFLYYLWALKFF